MTDPNATTPTTADANTETVRSPIDPRQLERIAALRRSRRTDTTSSLPTFDSSQGATRTIATSAAAPARRRRRRHPALGGRIASAGIGASAMLGIVAALGLAQAAADATAAPQAAAVAVPPVVVVVHRSEAPASAAAPIQTSGRPIELTANPVVRTVGRPSTSAAPAAAPVARTNGSN